MRQTIQNNLQVLKMKKPVLNKLSKEETDCLEKISSDSETEGDLVEEEVVD
jgi:hypothetical protein